MRKFTNLYAKLHHARAAYEGVAGLLVPAELLERRVLYGVKEPGEVHDGNGELEVVLRRVAAVALPPALPVRVANQRTSIIEYVVDGRRPEIHSTFQVEHFCFDFEL